MSVKIDQGGPRRSKDPVRFRKLRQTSQAAFAASSISSWFLLGGFSVIVKTDCETDGSSAALLMTRDMPRRRPVIETGGG